jgi:hypothetical protein
MSAPAGSTSESAKRRSLLVTSTVERYSARVTVTVEVVGTATASGPPSP